MTMGKWTTRRLGDYKNTFPNIEDDEEENAMHRLNKVCFMMRQDVAPSLETSICQFILHMRCSLDNKAHRELICRNKSSPAAVYPKNCFFLFIFMVVEWESINLQPQQFLTIGFERATEREFYKKKNACRKNAKSRREETLLCILIKKVLKRWCVGCSMDMYGILTSKLSYFQVLKYFWFQIKLYKF